MLQRIQRIINTFVFSVINFSHNRVIAPQIIIQFLIQKTGCLGNTHILPIKTIVVIFITRREIYAILPNQISLKNLIPQHNIRPLNQFPRYLLFSRIIKPIIGSIFLRPNLLAFVNHTAAANRNIRLTCRNRFEQFLANIGLIPVIRITKHQITPRRIPKPQIAGRRRPRIRLRQKLKPLVGQHIFFTNPASTHKISISGNV